MSNIVDFIDLTTPTGVLSSSVILCFRPPTTYVTNEIINVDSEESFEISEVKTTTQNVVECLSSTEESKSERDKHQPSIRKTRSSTLKNLSREKRTKQVGECPICWDELGKNSLSSTKCGHVFCTECLKQSLKMEAKCPSCRRALRGKSSYHPLYL